MSAPVADAAFDTEEFTRLPGVFRRWELDDVIVPGSDFHIEAAETLLPGTELYTVYRQPQPDLVPRRKAGAGRSSVTSPSPQRWSSPQDELACAVTNGGSALAQAQLRHREDHLCWRCSHHAVCGVAKAIDERLLVTIAGCLAFAPAEAPDDVVELQPIEPLAHH